MQDCRTYRGADISSDHELLVGTIKMKLARPKPGGKSRRFAVYKLNNPSIREAYREEVARNLCTERAGIEEDWQNIRDGLVQAAETTLGPPKTKRKEWISS